MGCGLKRKKQELLREIIKLENNQQLLMTGDRSYDMSAGKAVGAKCVGVLWGYGSFVELKKAGADVMVRNPQEALEYIIAFHY